MIPTPNPDRLVALLVILAVCLVIGSAIGAMVLRAAVSLFNKFAGGAKSSSEVRVPDFGKALVIMFLTNLVNFVASFGLGLAVGMGSPAIGARGNIAVLLAQLLSIPLTLLVMSTMLSVLLPTTFGRALGIAFCYLLIGLVIVVVVVLVTILASAVLFR